MPTCPYCQVEAERTDSAKIYNGRSFGEIYLCRNYPQCDARVSIRNGQPVGTLARHELRELRKRCHARFDPIWQTGGLSRAQAYGFLQKLMRLLNKQDAHIARFDERRCREFLDKIDCALCVDMAHKGEDFFPSHHGSVGCRSHSLASGGHRSHCTCDACF